MSDAAAPAGTARGARRILIVAQIDGYANGVRPVKIAEFLRARGHQVRVLDTYYLSRASSAPGARQRLPGASPAAIALYAVEAAGSILGRLGGTLRRHLSSPLLLTELALRRRLLSTLVAFEETDVVIVETPTDSWLLLDDRITTSHYDCPTPWADELINEGRLTVRQHRRMRSRERELYESVDVLSFHWESYADYAREHYGISGGNLMTLNWGCEPAARRARFDPSMRIVYLGSLSSQFIDLPLLARLSRLYPIDVYGGPSPDPDLGLNFLGWAPPEVLSNYQLGLVTCTRDELRMRGFSAKHLQYFAHGLPVLVPRWRTCGELERGSLQFDEGSFLSTVESVSHEAAWTRAAEDAWMQAQRYSWERTLAPLALLYDR